MKKKFSTSWNSSRQIRKQRKYRYNAPLHIRKKFVSANLSKELRKKIGKRSLSLRKNDVVKIMRGKFKGKTGKISKIDLKKLRINIEGIQRQKKDGTKVNVYIQPSKVQIISVSEERSMKQQESKEVKNAPKEK